MKKKTFCFDLDNTLCKTTGNKYSKSTPKKEAIKTLNFLFEKGHIIKIYTARYMGRNDNNVFKAKSKGFKYTYQQLKKWNVKFHRLYFGKPAADYYIDDKFLNFNKNWDKKLKEKFLEKGK